jgi:glycosyltransferase involved in cell wall biosynthesis
LNILTINTEALGGGASQIANSLSQFYSISGHTSTFLNALNSDHVQNISRIDNDEFRNSTWKLFHNLMVVCLKRQIPLLPKLFRCLCSLSEPFRSYHISKGHDDFYQPATSQIPSSLSSVPDVIHAHNLFGDFFDYRQIPRISSKLPFVMTLHDMWALTGHCSHPIDCTKWMKQCGNCPYPDLPPAIAKDGTAYNLALKKQIYLESRIHVATPSRWLMEQVESSILQPGVVSSKVIPNGVDQTAFKPEVKGIVRDELEIPQDYCVVLFVAAGDRTNPWKDYLTLDAAAERLAYRLKPRKLLLLIPGASVDAEVPNGVEVQAVPWTNDKRELAKYYQAADVYLHAANAENFPNVILEALSCGLPVVGTQTGGIPEQIKDGHTGYVVPQADPEAMADKAYTLLSSPLQLQQFSEKAAKVARDTFSLKRMGNDYLSWFEEILEAA